MSFAARPPGRACKLPGMSRSARKLGVFRLGLLACGSFWLSSCASSGTPPPAEAPSDGADSGGSPAAGATTPAEAAAEPSHDGANASSEPGASEPDADAGTATQEPTPHALCQKMCDRVRERCTPENTEQCRNNCREWDSPPPGCEADVRRALECASTAEDLQCVNIMPSSCTKRFKQIEACASGKRLDLQEISLEMPAGWQRFEPKNAGFAVPMPPGVEAKDSAGEKAYTANAGGVAYAVRVLPAPDPKTKDLLVAQNVLGDCVKKLKLKGLIERPERRSLEFSAGCAGGRDASGLLVTAGNKLYVVSVIGPTGAATQRDVFVYGFKAPL